MVGYHTRRTVDVTIIAKLGMKYPHTEKIGKEVEDYKCPRSYKVESKGVKESTVFKKKGGDLIFPSVVSDDYSLMKENIQQCYNELMGKES